VSNRAKRLSRALEIGHHQRVTVLERDAFLDSLVEYADEAAGGASRLMFLAGEAGVGKTTLLELLRQRLPHARWVVGACDGSFTPQPLGPLFDIAPQLGGAIADVCAEDAPRDRMFRVLLEQLAPPSLFTVLVIEDAHWADEATMDLVRFLGRRLHESPTLLLVSYRDEGLPSNHPVRVTLGDLTPERSLRRMTLAPLSPAAVSVLAAGSEVSGDELYALTGGNPFFVNEVLGINTPELPISARDAVLARVARLPRDARAVVDAVAVLGGDVDVATVSAVVGHIDGLDEALANGVIISEPKGVRFRHELARLAIEDAIPSHQQRELHTRALAALQATPDAELARLAHHAEGALDATAVLDYAVRAGERASELSSHRQAAAQYSRALRFAADRPIEERADLHDRLANELYVIEDWRQADAERARAVELWKQAGNLLRYGDSLRRLARARGRMFDSGAGALVDESIALLEELPASAPLAWAYSNRAALLMYPDPPRAIESAQHARKVLEESGADDPAVVSDSLNSEASAMFALGENPSGMLEEALQIALRGDAVEEASRAYANLVATFVNAGDLAGALRYAEEGMPYCEEHELALYFHCLRGGYVGVLDKLGRWDEAIEVCEQELSNPILSPFNRSGPCLTLGGILARRGDAAAAPWLAEGQATVKDMGCDEFELREVELNWLAGDFERARANATAIAAKPGIAAEIQSELAVWLRRLGEDMANYDLAVDPMRQRQLSEPWPDVAAMWAELGSPYEQALALYDSGEEEAMRESVAILDRLGATAAINAVRGEMRRRGFTSIPRGTRPTTRADRFGLTSRQREVLELLAQGLTNADISKRLVLSERTVDHHVADVLAKLGVDSRRDAVRLAAVAGGVDALTK
jgi:DNA-binding CsgD family transcriptional regulator/tetratricopeptide (TPR) repeat protein